MADSSPPADLLDRAGKVFSLAGELGRSFHEEHQRQGLRQPFDAAGWRRYAPAFDEFCDTILDLRDAVQHPPAGFETVAKSLLEAARIAKGIRDTLRRDGDYSACLDFFPDLNAVFQSGCEAIKAVAPVRRREDPFGFVDQPTEQPIDDCRPATPRIVESPGRLILAASGSRELNSKRFRNAVVQTFHDVAGVLHSAEVTGDWSAAEQSLHEIGTNTRATVESLAQTALVEATQADLLPTMSPLIESVRETFTRIYEGGVRGVDERRSTLDGSIFEQFCDSIKRLDLHLPALAAKLDAIDWLTTRAQRDAADAPVVANSPPPMKPAEPTDDFQGKTKGKRSTERGEGRTKLIAALTAHHQYAGGGCLNTEPIGNNELATMAGVSRSTASAFFNDKFNDGEKGGHAKYRATCCHPGRLADAIKALNGDFSPHDLYGRRPFNEAENDDEE